MLAVTILGNNSAVPAFDRHPTSQIITLDGFNFLVDCGEGTQIQMINYKIRRSRISHIFISHLHGDHYFGLIGLISSFSLLGRQQELHIIGPAPLQQLIELQLKVADTTLCFDLHFHTIRNEGTLIDHEKFSVKCFRTNHRNECYGFVFSEKKKPRRLILEAVKENNIPLYFYEILKEGEEFVSSIRELIKNEWLTDAAQIGKVYAFCADTKYDEEMISRIEDVDMIYHETTYLDNLRDRNEVRLHSTTRQAALIAQKGGNKKLLIGHCSSKYDTLEE